MKSPQTRLLIIFFATILAAFVSIPSFLPGVARPGIYVNWGRLTFNRDLDLKLGLDLAGGSHLAFEADMSAVSIADREAAIEGTKETIERRVNLFGVSESRVATSRVGDSYRVIAELPGIKDTQKAVDLIGETAKMEFKEVEEEEFFATDLSGADLSRAKVEFDPQTGKPVIGLEFTSEGGKKFQEITKKNVGKPLAIFIDQLLITAPVVQAEISGGNAVITGSFTLEEAKKLAVQLNSGALPVPVKLIEQRTIEASLGAEAVQASVFAGLVGLGMVAIFMIAYYGRLGFLAVAALLVYSLLTLAIYKLIPVVLTLPGIAGFILSIGMAVDSNILIFERMKEELRAGKGFRDSMEAGFGRAWDSIRDANIATLLTVFILLNPLNFSFLHTSGPVRGFALTLGLGIFISLFTGIFVTRTLLRTFARKDTA
ncbi:MAG: protein translocase subunit SecD [Candidatus Blackburnbacteria bacterium]|nr:protein translocase subunit SecD [Candidatus Blackburnbacteria bacterium]